MAVGRDGDGHRDHGRRWRRPRFGAADGFEFGASPAVDGLLVEFGQTVIHGVGLIDPLPGVGFEYFGLPAAFRFVVGTLRGFAFLDKVAHPFDIALGLLATGGGDGFIRAHAERGGCGAAGRVRYFGLAAGQPAFVDFGMAGQRQSQYRSQQQPRRLFPFSWPAGHRRPRRHGRRRSAPQGRQSVRGNCCG